MEVPKDRLATTDQYGSRVFLHPAEVKGFFRKWRTLTQVVLIILFMVLPWIKINGHQALLLNIYERRFAFFGITFFAHDGPLIFFLLAIGTLGLAFATAVWGRVWCGWACPQTVFIDGVFRRIEKWVEGDYIHRRQLDQEDLSFKKLWKKTLKWFLYFFVSTNIAHSFAAYFIGAERLAHMSLSNPTENWDTFLIVTFITLVILFDFGWFREQFCIIMCPYGRFQSVLMDKNSIAVLYDEKRGEPRKGSPDYETQKGDCVNCTRCVQVCPTAIDIRRGLQMECIACTACIDACDEIMVKVGKPKGLIRYSSLNALENSNDNLKDNTSDKKNPAIWKRARPMAYLGLILISAAVLAFNIITRDDLHVDILRVKGPPFRILDGTETGFIMNSFKAHIQNQSNETMIVEPDLENFNINEIQMILQNPKMELKPGEINSYFFFFKIAKNQFQGIGSRKIKIRLKYSLTNKIQFSDQEVLLLGPL
jgi:cytochrome c oxidase accessory protein FixG